MADLEADPGDVQAMHRAIIECHRLSVRPQCSKRVAPELALHCDLCFHLLDMLDETRADDQAAVARRPDSCCPQDSQCATARLPKHATSLTRDDAGANEFRERPIKGDDHGQFTA